MKIPNYFNKTGISNELNSSIIPLTFTAEEAGSTIALNANGSPTTSGLQYRYGTSGEWSIYSCGTTLTLENVGDVVQFQNTEKTLSNSNSNYVQFSMTGKIAGSGNIQSMLNYSNSCSAYCYTYMFYGCTNLTSAPELPATTLADDCYSRMFYGCTNLTSAPELPATTLADDCYSRMFNRCSKLNYIKVHFTSWHSTTTSNWLAVVASEGTFDAPRELPVEYGASRIPTNWTLPNHQNMILVEDQKIFSKYNNEINYNIDYWLQPETLQPTFTIIEGSLPNGLTLSSDGKITGTSTEEFDGNVVIQISCEGCESVTMTLSLTLVDAIETENNLTSNTSNEKYEVSQSSDYSSYYAWKAMDGNTSTYSRTKSDTSNDGWWQIKFNEGPVILKYITGTFQASSTVYTLYLDVSNDGENFENVTSFTGGSDLVIKTELNTPYQYYRIRNARNRLYTQITEIKFLYNYALNFLAASDQNFTFTMNEESEYQIKYMNTSETAATFAIIDGTLPNGISFDTATGKFSGTATEEFEGALTIQISNTYNTVLIQFNMKVIDIPDNLLFYAPLLNYKDTTAATGQELIKVGTLTNATIDGKNCVYFDLSCIYTENMGLEGHVSFTQSLWFNLKERNTSDNIILTMGNTSLYGTAHIKIQNFYNSYYTIRAGGWAMDYDPPTQFLYNKWYHLVQTYDNSTSTFKFYVNGVQVATNVCNDLNLVNYRIVIGAFAALDGIIEKSYISDVKIYNNCLSDAEIILLYLEQ